MSSGKAKTRPRLISEESLTLKARILDAAADSILLHDLDGNFIYFNEAASRMRGYSREEFQAMRLEDLLSPEQIRLIKSRISNIDKGRETVFESVQKHKDGSLIDVEVHSKVIVWEGQKYILSVTRDITQRKLAQDNLQRTLRRQDLVLNSLPVVFYTTDTSPQTTTTWINDQVKDLTGYLPEQFIQEKNFWENHLHPDDRERALNEYREIFHKDSSSTEYRWLCVDGVYHWFIDRIILVRDERSLPKEIMGVWVDITERKRAEEGIRASLEEKEVLLKEIHHRVKNNMQIISSLISLQAKQLTDQKAIDMFVESQQRIRSMALIHEKLYQSKTLSEIDFSEYIERLITHHFHAYGGDSDSIKIIVNAERIALDINTAIPAGLILNELVSNCLKHAFPPGKKGEIRVGFQRLEKDQALLTVADTGIGLPKDFDIQNSESLGMQIVTMLAEQLEAKTELLRDKGTTFKFIFKGGKYKKRI